MVVMSAKLAKGQNISWNFPEYLENFVHFFCELVGKKIVSFQKFTERFLPRFNPTCHCNEMGNLAIQPSLEAYI